MSRGGSYPHDKSVHSHLMNIPLISKILLEILLLVIHGLLNILKQDQGPRHYPIIHPHWIELFTEIYVRVG